jgi:RimJ/RimL family protein N-acetyltransferase
MFETERIRIKILNGHELILYSTDPCAFAKTCNLVTTQSKIEDELLDAIQTTFLPNVNDPRKEYLFYTIWLIIDKQTQAIVGSFCFHGEPENGIIEIGYGIHEDSRNQGFMSEMITGLLEWASLRTDIETIIAEIDNDNIASIKTLEKSGFKLHEIIETTSVYFCKLQTHL